MFSANIPLPTSRYHFILIHVPRLHHCCWHELLTDADAVVCCSSKRL